METSASVTAAYGWHGRTLIGSRGERIGTVEAIYADVVHRRVEWALVRSGRFMRKATFVPLAGARPIGEDVRVPHTKEEVRDAPAPRTGDLLSPEDEGELFAYYGMRYAPAGAPGTTRLRQVDRATLEQAAERPEIEI